MRRTGKNHAIPSQMVGARKRNIPPNVRCNYKLLEMKKWMIILLSIITLNSHSQTNDREKIFLDYEQMPTFPGKSDSVWCLIESNFRYDILNARSDTVKYIIRFRLDTLGIASDFEIVRSYPITLETNYPTNDSIVRSEILRVFRMMPRWEPGSIKGKKVNCWISTAITIPYSKFKCHNKNN